MEQKIKAYKAFDKDLSCRGFKYEVGKEYEETGDIKACEKGFHACPYPLAVFGYYAPAGARFCEVEQSGKIDDSEGDKVCSSKIRIGAELDIRGLVKAAVSFVKERCTNECNAEPHKTLTWLVHSNQKHPEDKDMHENPSCMPLCRLFLHTPYLPLIS